MTFSNDVLQKVDLGLGRISPPKYLISNLHANEHARAKSNLLLTKPNAIVESMWTPTGEFMATCHGTGSMEVESGARGVARSAKATPLGDAYPMRRRSERDDPLAAQSVRQRCARGCRSLLPSTKYTAAPVARF